MWDRGFEKTTLKVRVFQEMLSCSPVDTSVSEELATLIFRVEKLTNTNERTNRRMISLTSINVFEPRSVIFRI
jgi:hypothetical protein